MFSLGRRKKYFLKTCSVKRMRLLWAEWIGNEKILLEKQGPDEVHCSTAGRVRKRVGGQQRPVFNAARPYRCATETARTATGPYGSGLGGEASRWGWWMNGDVRRVETQQCWSQPTSMESGLVLHFVPIAMQVQLFCSTLHLRCLFFRWPAIDRDAKRRLGYVRAVFSLEQV